MLKITLNFISFTTIDRQVLQFKLISFLGKDVSTRGSLLWEKAGVPGENPHVQASDRHTLSHTTTNDHANWTRVAAVKNECIVHCPTWKFRCHKMRYCTLVFEQIDFIIIIFTLAIFWRSSIIVLWWEFESNTKYMFLQKNWIKNSKKDSWINLNLIHSSSFYNIWSS